MLNYTDCSSSYDLPLLGLQNTVLAFQIPCGIMGKGSFWC